MRHLACFLLALFAPLAALLAVDSPLPVSGWDLEATVPVEATVQSDPPAITLEVHKKERSYQVFRKGPHDLVWSDQIGTIPAGSGLWTDTNVVVGQEYEYRIYGGQVQSSVSYRQARLYGYIRCGIEVDMTDWRGRVVLVVADEVPQMVPEALAQYKEDLVGDGWTVHTVMAPEAPNTFGEDFLHEPVRDEIIAIYNQHPGEVKHVVLIGNVPQPRAGLTEWGPDGHRDEAAFGADAYYADVDGTWSDVGDNSYRNDLDRARTNVPNDGKYDEERVPSDDLEYFEMGFGRIDFRILNEGNGLGLQNYFEKLHRYKHATPDFRPGRRSAIRAGFDNVSETGWNTLPALVGLENVDYYGGEAGSLNTPNDFDEILSSEFGPYLFYFKGNSVPKFTGVGRAVIWTGLQSNWGYWWKAGNMAETLASDSWALSITWSVWGWYYFYHRLGMGDVMGDMMKVSINNRGWQDNEGLYTVGSDYWPNGDHTGFFFMNHIGDPMLRLYMYPPAANLSATEGAGGVELSWEPSPDPEVSGYHIYRSNSMDEPFARLTTTPVAGTTYEDSEVSSGRHHYMVRAVKLETTGSGTFYNASQGIFQTIDLDAAPPALAVATASLPLAFPQVPYEAWLSAEGGFPPYTWSVQSGVLPEGMELRSDGLLSGTPLESGSFPVTVQAIDAAGNPDSKTLTLGVSTETRVAFHSEADAQVWPGGNANKNYGGLREVRLSGDVQGYFRFSTDLPDDLSTVTSATLRFWPTDISNTTVSHTIEAALVDDDGWVEGAQTGRTANGSEITYNNRPADSNLAPVVTRDGAFTLLEPFDIDVTSLVNADLAADSSGVVSLRVTAQSGVMEVLTHEALIARFRPVLILEYSAGPRVQIVSPSGGRSHLIPGREAVLSAEITHPSIDPSTLALHWSVEEQPAGANVTFADSATASTTASFDETGTYRLRLTANDGTRTGFAEVTLHVSPTTVLNLPAPEIAHFPLDDGAGAVARNLASGPDGTLGGFDLANAWSNEGRIGGALDLSADDGSNTAHLLALTDSAYDFSHDRGWTVSMWLKFTQGGNKPIAGKAMEGLGEEQFALWSQANNARSTFNIGGTSGNLGEWNTAHNDGRWRMMTFVYDPSQQAAIGFIDGGEDGIRVLPARPTNDLQSTSRADFLIGALRNNDNTDFFGDFDGLVDEVRVYDRVLSYSEVRDLYLGTPLNQAPAPTIVPVDGVPAPGNAVTLNGTVADDGLPMDGTLTVQWEKASGPGDVVFGSPNALTTTATFSVPGDYQIRLIADDGESAAATTLAVAVAAPGGDPGNAMPIVDAGADQNLTSPGDFTLAGSATDDGVPGALTYHWQQTGGPAQVQFDDPTRADATVTLFGFGTYTLELTASDGSLASRDSVVLVVGEEPAANTPPMVEAGADITGAVNQPITLSGSASDDGLPNPPGSLSTTWSEPTVNGVAPTAVITSPTSLETTVTFPDVGDYVLQLEAFDGARTVRDFVAITVTYDPTGNGAPDVDLGPDQSIVFPRPATLTPSIADDGLPDPPATLELTWRKVSGPGSMTVQTITALEEYELTFGTEGTYEVELAVNDGAAITTDTLLITTSGDANATPVVDLGPDQLLLHPVPALIEPVISDDDALTDLVYQWSLISGPGEMFTGELLPGEAYTVAFDQPGTYEVSLSVFDGNSSGFDSIVVEVEDRAVHRRVWAWGQNVNGSAGPFEVGEDMTRPYFVGTGWRKVAPGARVTYLLDATGKVLASGLNTTAALGEPDLVDRHYFAEVPGLPRMIDVANYSYYSEMGGAAVDRSGRVWTWGDNEDGKNGDGSFDNSAPKSPPAPIANFDGVESIDAQGGIILAIKTDGTIYGWGADRNSGALGNGAQSSIATPTQIPNITTAKAAACGWYHTVILLEDGTLRAAGWNSYGSVGDGTEINPPAHVPVLTALPDTQLTGVTKAAAGFLHTLALTEAGHVYAWGYNNDGQLGVGDKLKRTLATQVTDPDDPTGFLTGIVDVAAGFYSSYAVKEDGTVLAWGRGTEHNFGNGTETADRLVPSPVSGLPAAIVAIWANDDTPFAATAWADWASFQEAHFTAQEISEGKADPDYDYLGNGRTNLMAYLLNENPKTPPDDQPVSTWMEGRDFLAEIEYLSSAGDLSVLFESSFNLIHWDPVAPENLELNTHGDTTRATFRKSMDLEEECFFRLRVIQNE